jgi:hypothetical protein
MIYICRYLLSLSCRILPATATNCSIESIDWLRHKVCCNDDAHATCWLLTAVCMHMAIGWPAACTIVIPLDEDVVKTEVDRSVGRLGLSFCSQCERHALCCCLKLLLIKLFLACCFSQSKKIGRYNYDFVSWARLDTEFRLFWVVSCRLLTITTCKGWTPRLFMRIGFTGSIAFRSLYGAIRSIGLKN